MGFSRKVADLPAFMRDKPKRGGGLSPKHRARLLREMEVKDRARREGLQRLALEKAVVE
jgi:hypothetical protein